MFDKQQQQNRNLITTSLPLSITTYPALTPIQCGFLFSVKITAKDDPKISCSHLVAEKTILEEGEIRKNL